MGNRAVTLLTNLGPRRRLPYVLPSGLTLRRNQQVQLSGILETQISLSHNQALIELFLRELEEGLISVEYRIDGLSPSGPVDVTALLSRGNINLTPAPTSGNFWPTGILLGETPSGQGAVVVDVNGITASVGDGVKTADCYFSTDGGVTAKTIDDFLIGDELIWNGVIAGYDLDADDRVSFLYVVGAGA